MGFLCFHFYYKIDVIYDRVLMKMDTYIIISLDLLKSIVVGLRSLVPTFLFMVASPSRIMEGPDHVYLYLLAYLILELRLAHLKYCSTCIFWL
jgi:hypothetical protein